MSKLPKITSLALLRGLSVLAVCFCHFAKPAADGRYFHDLFKGIENYAQYSIHVFFLISGFVIPYSLASSSYTFRDYPLFLLKRFLRLHPPYLVALAFTLLVAGASYAVRHLPNPETNLSMAESLFFLHIPGDNPVFWTLIIEIEFYTFIGLFFVLLTSFPKLSLMLGIPILLFISQTAVAGYIGMFSFIPFFMTGTIGYLISAKREERSDYWLELIALTIVVVFSFIFYKPGAGIASLSSLLVILFFNRPVPAWLEFPGEISYSLYLTHFPLGTKLMNLLQRHIDPGYHWALFILTNVVCFLFAWLFWKLIEKPSTRLTRNIKYGQPRFTRQSTAI